MGGLNGWALCQHGLRICSRCVVASDAGKRISEAIGIAITFHTFEEIRHSWMAFKLEDGQTDHTLYPSKAEAIRHCSNENLYCFVFMGNAMGGMSPKDATLWIMFQRHAQDTGMSLKEPTVDMIFPLARGTSRNFHV